MLLQCPNGVLSWLVGVHGKVRLEGNGRSPWQEALRSPWAPTNQPAGRTCGAPQMRCSAWQGLRPLPAHYAFLRTTTSSLSLSLGH